MNKKLFKKLLTAVLTAAMLFTSNGFASLNASATEKIYVEGVYTNFQRATMSTDTSRQINAYVEPADATVQRLQYKSSAPEVASVSSTGLISALSPGKATITVTALDGSSQTETIEITVLEDLIITKDMVDSDNEVIVLDQNLGNLYIDSSVGDADIYIGGVRVRNILGMDSGEYSLFLYDTTVKELKIDQVLGEIESFAIDEEDAKAPNLIIGENTQISDLNARISASIRQEDGSAIEDLRVTQDEDGKITVYLENYSGELLLDASFGDMEIVTIGCSLSNVIVDGDEDVGIVQLTDGGESEIANLALSGAAKVELGVPTNEVNIDRKAKGVTFASKADIGSLTNVGSDSNIIVSAAIDNFADNGSNGKIEVASGGYVGMINLNGEGSKLFGAGEVSEAYVNANNVSVDTINTLVLVGEVTGTKIQGVDAAAGSTETTKPPASGGGGGPVGPSVPEEPVVVGEVIIDNDFEDGTHDLRSIQGDVTIRVIDSGDPERGNIASISGKNADWAGAGIDLSRYIGKYVTIEITALIKADKAGEVKATIKYNDEYTQPDGCKVDAEADTWTELNGTFLLDSTIETAILYFEAPGSGMSTGNSYYLDDVKITVKSIGEPIAAETVTLDQSELLLNINEVKKLTATISPNNADVRTVTWLSSDPEVATVDADGTVRGITAGTATITAISDCPYAESKPFAECEVEVQDVVVIELNKNYIFFTAVGETDTLTTGGDTTWLSSDETVATVSETGLVTAVGNGTATITGTIPGGIGTCIVNVELQPEGSFVFDFDDKDVGTEVNFVGSGKATIVKDPTVVGSTNKVLWVETVNGYSEFAYFEIAIPDGKKLGDYVSLLAKLHLAEGDVGYKSLRVWAGETLADISVGYNPSASQIGASEDKSGNIIFEPVTAEFTTMSASLRNLTGTIVLGLGIMAEPGTEYALDEIILVPYTGDPVAITGITLNKDKLTLVEGRSENLTATIVPDDATTNREITWTSSDENVATVDASGKVTAIKAGTAIITATTAIDGVSDKAYSATCAVTVTEAPADPADMIKVDFESDAVDTPYKMIGWSPDDGSAKVVQVSETNKALEVRPGNYNNAAVISITLPEGRTLGDYSDISYKVLWKEGDVGNKDVVVEAGESLSGGFANDTSRTIASYYRAEGPTTEFQEETIALNGNLSELSGTIEIALGINCAANKEGVATVYYLDDITLIPKEGLTEEELLFSTNFENSEDPFTEWSRDDEGPVQNGGVVGVTGSAIGFILEINATNEEYADSRGIGYYFASAGTYRIEARVKNAEAVTGSSIRLQEQKDYQNINNKSFEINSDEWFDINETFTLEEGEVKIILAPHFSDPTFHFYIAEFKVYRIKE